MKDITSRQKEMLDYIAGHIENKGFPPTVREIASHFDLVSAAGVHKHIKALVRKNYIKKDNNLSRSLRVVAEPLAKPTPSQTVSIPLLGYVAAGKPIEAIQASEEHLVIPGNLGTGRSNQFLLKVRGDSMIEDGILDGDFVILEHRKEARNGETVVALIDGREATLKKLYREGGSIRLQPANSSMEPIMLHEGELEVQGVVIGLWRPYPIN